MQVNFPGVDFLGTVLRKKNCCSLLMSSITHETRHFHGHGVTYQHIVLIKTCFFFTFSLLLSPLFVKLPNSLSF